MINLYSTVETSVNNFEKNGDLVITPTKAILNKYENGGDYFIELETTLDYLDYITEARIVKADMPWGDYELFRISDVSTDHKKVKCKCVHITYDMKYAFTTYPSIAFEPDTQYSHHDVNGMLANILNNVPATARRRVASGYVFVDVTHTSSFPVPKYYITKAKGYSYYDVITDVKKFYDAYLYRTKLEMYLLPSRTTFDSEITIEYGKNLQEITKIVNWDNFAGTLIATTSGVNVINTYTCPDALFFPPSGMNQGDYGKAVTFQSSLSSSSYNDRTAYLNAVEAEQQEKATEYFQKYGHGIITYNFKGNIDKDIDLGAKIKVIDRVIGADVETVVTGFKYDLILNKYLEIEFDNSSESIKGYNSKVNDKISISEKNAPFLSYPVGSIYVNTGNTPNMGGFWELQSSSGGLYTWKRTA